MEIYLIRHTTPDIEKGICYGQTDIALKDAFEKEAEKVLLDFPEAVGAMYTSPLSRCLQLANYLSTHKKLPVYTDARLKELNFGGWEMKEWNLIEPVVFKRWMDDYVNVKCPNGESYQELAARVSIFLDDLKSRKNSRIAIVTHHGVMKAIYALLNKVSLIDAMRVQFPVGSVFCVKC
jgi:alpha-ribazole phosphatase